MRTVRTRSSFCNKERGAAGLRLIPFFILSLISVFSQQMDGQTLISLDPSSASASMNMPWKNTITVGRAYDLLRQDLQDHLQFIQEKIGYRYCRFHAIFDDDMSVVTRGRDGHLIFQWDQVDKVYDALLKMNLKPFVELNPMPRAMASGNEVIFRYRMNVTPPKDYAEWALLVDSFVKHLVSRYGREEVKSWYFEVWNEPNLSGFWTGTREDYFHLYQVSAQTIKSIDKDFRVGGPATSKGEWVTDLIRYCSEQDVPLDFVSTHLYPQDEFVLYPDKLSSPYGPGMFFTEKIREIEQSVRESQKPGLEIHITEWNSLSTPNKEEMSWTGNKFTDNLYAAAFIVNTAVRLDDDVTSLAYWTASDVFSETWYKNKPFNSHYGLLTVDGIPKASFNAFLFLSRMKGPRVSPGISGDLPAGCGAVAVKEFETLRILVWNYKPVEMESRAPWYVEIKPSLDASKEYTVTRGKISLEAGSPLEAWHEMGSPVNLTAVQSEMLWQRSFPAYEAFKLEGDDLLKENLKSGEVVLMEITPAANAFGKPAMNEDTKKWNKAMGEKSRK